MGNAHSKQSDAAFEDCKKQTEERIHKLLSIKGHRTVNDIHRELGNIMWEYVGMARNEADLKTALENDVTQINVGSEKCYLSPILDMYNGEIISYAISDHSDLNMVMEMLNRAYTARKVKHGLILHSDQGWHYQHTIYQKSLRNHEIIQSMSRKGNCLDNAMMESFFGIMKSELLYPNTFNNMDHFKQELRKYIEYYNNDRIKLRLKGMSPVEYRTHNSILS